MRMIILADLLAFCASAHAAGDAGKWGHDPATSEWFKGLKDKHGFPCCDYVDGTRIEDPDWKENEDGSYEVRLGAEVLTIPPDKIVDGANRVGYAILWRSPAGMVYCFLPGART